jgi:pyrimidine-nucleoside phosphorylase
VEGGGLASVGAGTRSLNAKSIIFRKREGARHTIGELRFLIEGALAGRVAEYHLTAWMMAVFFRGMDPEETADLTRVMIESGDRVSPVDGPVLPVDKHSTGGVGDKISFLVAPLVAAAGAPVPMVSGRSLGHTGGTLDKLESIPGLRTDLGSERFREQVARIGLGIASQSANLVPADRLLYALRDAASIVESIPLITASILSKKVAEGARALVLDVKVGSGAFMTNEVQACQLAEGLVRTAAGLGLPARAYMTRMESLLGRTAGNALEIRESILALKEGPDATAPDLRELTRVLGGAMLELAGAASSSAEGEARIEQLWRSGAGLEKLRAMIEAQEGDPAVIDDLSLLPAADRTVEIEADQDAGYCGVAARPAGDWITESGGGRLAVGMPIDPTIGVEVLIDPGSRVARGEPVLRLHVPDDADEAALVKRARAWIQYSAAPYAAPSTILQVIG